MEYPKEWSFKSKNIADNFDQHVRQSVPLYDEIQRMIIELAGYFLRKKDNVLDIGCSTGTTLNNIYFQYNNRISNLDGIDESQEMINKIKLLTNMKIIKHDINEGLPLNLSDNYSLVTSVFTLQFIKVEIRLNLIRDIYKKLRNGGALILVEKIHGNNADFNEMMVDLYQDMKIRNGLSPQNNLSKSKSLRGIMQPLSLDENKIMLITAGFKDIDVFFKWYNFVGIIAVK